MKRFQFIYRADRESLCDPYFGYVNQTETLEKEFPSGVTDWEVLLVARRHEVKDLREDQNTASDGILNRVLVRVIHPVAS
jgi:hypothetical protein